MKKKLTKFNILTLVIGSIVGWGSFTLPQNKFLPNSGVINTTIGLLLGAFLILFIEKGYSVMMKNSKKEDGGEFSYTYANLGRKHGFIVGWSLSLCYLSLVPLNATAFVLVFKIIYPHFSYLYLYSIAGYKVYLSDIVLSQAIIIIFALINIKGIKLSSIVQNILIILLILNTFIVLITMLNKVDLNQFKVSYLKDSLSIKKILSVVAIVPFLFVGFDVIVQVSTDLGFDRKKTSFVAILGILFGSLIYSTLNIITALAYSPDQLSNKQWALGEGVLLHIGVIGFSFLVIALLAAVTGGINGFMLSCSKLLGSISTYNLMPKKYSAKNSKNVYSNSIYFIVIVSMITPFFGREVIIYIVDLCSALAGLTYAYVSFISINKTDNKIDKAITILGFIISIIFIILLIFPLSPAFLSIPSIIFMLVWAILGVIYYSIYKNKV